MRRAAALPTPSHSAARVGNTPRPGVQDWSDLDRPFTQFGWSMAAKDLPMTIRQAMNNIGNYGCTEAPGAAFAYNDYLTKLEALTARRAAGQSLTPASTALGTYMDTKLAALQLQDSGLYNSTVAARQNLGQELSARDMARLALLLLNRGNWNGTQILDASFFDRFLSLEGAGCGWACPRSTTPEVAPDDYLSIGTYGGGVNDAGADIPTRYVGHLWVNGLESSGARAWPDLPLDAFVISGHGGTEHYLGVPSLKLLAGGYSASSGFGNPGVAAATSTTLNDIHGALIDGILGAPNYADAFPGTSWATTTAGDANISSTAVTNYRTAVNSGTLGNKGMIIIAGKVVSEWGDLSELYDWSSGGKWSLPLAFGCLAQDGLLTGVS